MIVKEYFKFKFSTKPKYVQPNDLIISNLYILIYSRLCVNVSRYSLNLLCTGSYLDDNLFHHVQIIATPQVVNIYFLSQDFSKQFGSYKIKVFGQKSNVIKLNYQIF